MLLAKRDKWGGRVEHHLTSKTAECSMLVAPNVEGKLYLGWKALKIWSDATIPFPFFCFLHVESNISFQFVLVLDTLPERNTVVAGKFWKTLESV